MEKIQLPLPINFECIYSGPKFYKLKLTNRELYKFPIRTPECQRVLDNSHINDINEFQNKHLNEHGDFFFPNALTFTLLQGKFDIIDGQHRFNCIRNLTNQYPTKTFDVFCDIYIVNDQDELEDKYKGLNENKKVCLPPCAIVYKSFSKRIEEHINDNYSIYNSRSEKPNIPNFNQDKLFIKLSSQELDLSKRCKNDYMLFIREMELLNTFYQQQYSNPNISKHFANIEKSINRCKNKQSKKPFVLGLYKQFEWIDRILYKIETGTKYEQMEHIHVGTRFTIKKVLRRKVWQKHNQTSIEGSCYVCSKSIDYDHFQCGHIKPVFYGGTNSLDNLKPICSVCNLDMGIQNLEEYKIYYEQNLI
tara:strand:- start:2205 stop:3290 length:1086 start_codon:yes stop_codon:yes gene_type:complete